MSTTVGTAVTQTIYVKGSNLASGAGVSLSCQGTGFSVDKTNITRTAAMNGVNVTVTYNPTASGTHTGTLTLTSTNAETVVVPLNGTAVGTPKITVNPTALSFTATVGETLTKTFTVTGTDLTGAVMLAVTGNGFSIDKTNITKNAAAEGATVTVTFRPTAAGTVTGNVTLNVRGQIINVELVNGSGIAIAYNMPPGAVCLLEKSGRYPRHDHDAGSNLRIFGKAGRRCTLRIRRHLRKDFRSGNLFRNLGKDGSVF